MFFARASSNLKGTMVKKLNDAASYINAAWKSKSSSGTAFAWLWEARNPALEEEIAALRQELSRLTALVRECSRCTDWSSESRPPALEDKSDRERIAALERTCRERIDALDRTCKYLGPYILRDIEERFGSRRLRIPESRHQADHSTTRRTTQTTALPWEQESGEWRVVERRKHRKKKKKRKTVTTGDEAAKK